MGGKKGKKVKSTQSKKGKTKESKNSAKPPLQEEDKGDEENVSPQEDLPEVEAATAALHLDEETETKTGSPIARPIPRSAVADNGIRMDEGSYEIGLSIGRQIRDNLFNDNPNNRWMFAPTWAEAGLEDPRKLKKEIVDVKNNNATPPPKCKSEDPAESWDTTKTEDAPKMFSSPGLDRRKSLSNLEIHSPPPPSEKKDPTVVQDQDSVNYNNNIAQKMSQGQDQKEEGLGTAKKLVPTKHPLEHSWTLWWFSNKNKNWEAEEVLSFATIEDFWAAMNWTQPASKLGINCDYAVFKKGTKPDWEDRNNSLGGRWIIERTKMEDMDSLWMESLFIMIGEHLYPQSELINGAVIQKKKGRFKLAFWLKDSNKERVLIGKLLRERLNITGSDSMEFRVHTEEQKQRHVGRQPGKFFPNVSFKN